MTAIPVDLSNDRVLGSLPFMRRILIEFIFIIFDYYSMVIIEISILFPCQAELLKTVVVRNKEVVLSGHTAYQKQRSCFVSESVLSVSKSCNDTYHTQLNELKRGPKTTPQKTTLLCRYTLLPIPCSMHPVSISFIKIRCSSALSHLLLVRIHNTADRFLY